MPTATVAAVSSFQVILFGKNNQPFPGVIIILAGQIFIAAFLWHVQPKCYFWKPRIK